MVIRTNGVGEGTMTVTSTIRLISTLVSVVVLFTCGVFLISTGSVSVVNPVPVYELLLDGDGNDRTKRRAVENGELEIL